MDYHQCVNKRKLYNYSCVSPASKTPAQKRLSCPPSWPEKGTGEEPSQESSPWGERRERGDVIGSLLNNDTSMLGDNSI